MALSQRTRAVVAPRQDDRVRVTSEDRSWEGPVNDLSRADPWALYVTGVLLALEVRSGADITISSDVPIGAGLSSSAALECSVAVAIDEVFGLDLSAEDLVKACVRAEQEYVGAPTGGLDQTIAVYAEPRHALLIDFADDSREQVPFDPEAHGLALLVIDTRVSHELIDGGYGSRRDEAWAAAEALGVASLGEVSGTERLTGLPEPLLRRARHVVGEVARVDAFVEALRADDWDALGPLMLASHLSLRDDYEVSCDELDVTVDVAVQAGAVGARMTGGGFGGSAIALVPVERMAAVEAAVTTAFISHGWRRPEFITAEPGHGATTAPA